MGGGEGRMGGVVRVGWEVYSEGRNGWEVARVGWEVL